MNNQSEKYSKTGDDFVKRRCCDTCSVNFEVDKNNFSEGGQTK